MLTLSFGYPCWVSNQWELSHWLCTKFPAFQFSQTALWLVEYQTKDYINLQINKKESSSIDLDINNSKVSARDIYTFILLTCPVNSALNFLLSAVQSGNLKEWVFKGTVIISLKLWIIFLITIHIYLSFGITLTQFYINFSRQGNQIELILVAINS